MKPRDAVLHSYRFPAEAEPDGDVSVPHHFYLGAILAWYGFQFVWPTYPVLGALATICGTLIMSDDVISHAFGVWTPLDWGWKRILALTAGKLYEQVGA